MRVIKRKYTGFCCGTFTGAGTGGQVFEGVVEYVNGEDVALYVPKKDVDSGLLFQQLKRGDKSNVGKTFRRTLS